MSAEVETMAFKGEVPWHGLGTRIEGTESPEEMARLAGLDWTVEKSPLFFEGNDGEVYDVPGRYALTRNTDNKVFGIAGAGWTPMQNSEVLGFMHDYVQAGGAVLETAGSLKGGKIVWGLARLNHDFEARKGDKLKGYILLVSPHEVGRSIFLSTTSVRVVCWNTMCAANREGVVEYRQSHVGAFRVDDAKASIENSHECLKLAAQNAQKLTKLKLSDKDVLHKILIPTVLPDDGAEIDLDNMPKKIVDIQAAILNGPGASPGDGWGVLNGVTFYADHIAGKSADTRLTRSWTGDLRNLKVAVEAKLLELV